uniref:Phospholipase-like protein n=1 Tax=Tanacetum cinerariifolium TaxID=118510 RepID=A0A6L2NLV3_TANCI|nr:hypothetical protein [Tanacetum cinerariifolium]
MKVEESLNVTFDETLPPPKTSHLEDDDLVEEEAIKVNETRPLGNDVEDKSLEIIKSLILKNLRVIHWKMLLVPRVLVTCRSHQLEVEGDGNENVPLYYYINDNIRIHFGREEFCLVTGLRFRVENLADYDDVDLHVPFRRRVFLSYLDGEHITGNMVFKIIDDELFDRLHDDDVVSLCCLGILQLVLLGVEAKRRIPDWMLRLANDRVGKSVCCKIDTRRDRGSIGLVSTGWSPIILDTSKQQLLLQYRYANALANPKAVATWFIKMANLNVIATWSIKLVKPDAGAVAHSLLETDIPSHPGTYNWQSPIPSHMGNSNLQPPIWRHHDVAGLFDQKSNVSPFNLGNALDDEYEGGDDVIFLGGQFTGNYLVYENVDISKVRRENYVDYADFLNNPEPIYLDCYMKGYLVPVTFWQQLVPHLCMPDFDSNTPVGWLSGEEDRVRQLAMMNLAYQFNDASIAKDELRKAYEECRDIPLEQRDVIEKVLEIESELDYEMNIDLLWNGAKLRKQIRDKKGWINMLL